MSNKEEAIAKAAAADSFPMKGGDGFYSYSKNSSFQRKTTDLSKAIVADAISDNLDINKIFATSSTYRIADFGCSVGPNTFIAMQNVIEAVQHKCINAQSKMPQFQVFFNDHVSNDFNTLFASLPCPGHYFTAGVPGSFYGRLFPESCLHFVHSCHALNWLSEAPSELLDNESPSWNKGRVHYYGAPNEVVAAYATQFAKDMETFLDARAKELVPQGLLVVSMPAIPNSTPRSCTPMGFTFDLVGACLMDMANEGLIAEAQVDSFNLPLYLASPREVTQLVEKNGCFSIERMELPDPKSRTAPPFDGKQTTMHVRASMEGIISKHFGTNIIDQLFNRFLKKTEEFSSQLKLCRGQGTQLFAVLKRK